MVILKLYVKYNGIYEWLLVRFSAFLILLYILYISSFIFFTNTLCYEQWYNFFNKNITKIFSAIALCAVLIHCRICMRHVLEDYVKFIMLKRLSIWIINMILLIYLLLGMITIWRL